MLHIIISFHILLRSPVHCTSFCIATPGCSAFRFNKESGSCGLGSKAGLISAQPSDSEAQLTQISFNTEGNHIFQKLTSKFPNSLKYFLGGDSSDQFVSKKQINSYRRRKMSATNISQNSFNFKIVNLIT